MIDFGSFVERVGGIIGQFELKPCSRSNGLIHPYQSADIMVDGKSIGYLSKLHPSVQDRLGICDRSGYRIS